MSFAEGFAKAFVPGLQQGANLILQGEMELFRESMKDFKNEKNKYTKAQLDDLKIEQQAKALVKETPGIPDSAVPAVYNSIRAGRSPEAIRRDLVEGGITAARTSGATSRPASTPTTAPVDTQMSEAGLANPKVTPPSVQGGSEPTTNEDGSVSFNFTKWMNQRREDAVGKAANMTPDQVKTIKSGYTPQVKESEVAIVPRPVKGKGTGEGAVLTAGRIASELAGYEQRAATGDPAAIKARDEYVAGPYKIKMDAIKATKGTSTPLNLEQAQLRYDQAKKSGNAEEIEAAGMTLDSFFKAKTALDALSKSGDVISAYKINEKGEPEFKKITVRPGRDGGLTKVDSATNKPIDSSEWRLVDKDQQTAATGVQRSMTSQINKFKEGNAALASSVRLAGETLDIVDKQPQALTAVAEGVKRVLTGVREVNAALGVAKELLGKSDTATISIPTLEKAMRDRGLLPEDQTLESVANQDPSKITSLAQARSALDAKITLLTFRTGALEGQSGNAMSNKDFDRLSKIVNATSSPEGFKSNLTNYMRGLVYKQEDLATQLNSDTVGEPAEFKRTYGYRPVESVQDFNTFVDSRNEPSLKGSYQRIMGVRVPPTTTAPRTQAAPPSTSTQGLGAPTGATPTAAPAQPAAPKPPTSVPIKRGEAPQAKGIPPTVKFVEIDTQGRAIYQDESGKKFTDRRFTYSFQD